MESFLKIAGWTLVGLIALFVWFAFPRIHQALAFGVDVALLYYLIKLIGPRSNPK